MRPIDADARIDDLMERYCKDCDKRKGMKNGKRQFIYEIGDAPCRACGVDDVKAELEEAPTIDPVKHGEWIKHVLKNANVPWGYDCSACGAWFVVGEDTVEKYYYCPNCGARMSDECAD